jgi:D-alanyl-D-alanine carboxypeptidase (penicillin-binding protein 5/6)
MRFFQSIAICLTLCATTFTGFSASTKTTKASSPSKTSTTSTKAPHGIISKNPYLGAIVMDAASGKVLFEDQPDAKGYPASMLKLMDLLVVLEKVERKEISLQDQVPVSARAAGIGGTQVWLAEKESFALEDMLYALMIQSANDAAVAVAEKVAGSTEGFIELMNKKAKQLGMSNTVFNSVNGLPPSKGQDLDWTTARDFAILSRELISKHPEALRYTSTRERTFRPDAGKKTVVMRSHNHLLASVQGCDGLKTGYITSAGFSIAVTAQREGQRVIVVVLDSVDSKTRDKKAAELVEKGFSVLRGSTAETSAKAASATAKKK